MKKLVQLIRNNAQRAPAKIVAEDKPDTLFLYDVIDSYWGVSANEFNKALNGLAGKKVTLRVNSPGGDVFDGRAMAAAIAQHGNVHAVIEGLAASAATYVTAACASVTIAKGAFYMIHNAWTMSYGDKEELRQIAELLDKIDETIVDDYERKTGQSREQLTAWMNAETWFTADEAVEHGFVDALAGDDTSDEGAGDDDEKESGVSAWDLSAFKNAPKKKPNNDADWKALRQRNLNRLRLHEIG
jgi:ATP-dependent Clp protease protease subunit